MAASVTNVYDVLDVVKNEVDCICAKENVSPLAHMAIAKGSKLTISFYFL